MTPIERAARAICVTFGYDPDKDDEVGLGEPGDVNWNMFEDHARAVLTALREPSEGMKEAGWFRFSCAHPDQADADRGPEISIWQAMIDAALEQG